MITFFNNALQCLRLSENERNQIIAYLLAGSSISHVAKLFNMRRETVYDLRRCYQATRSTRDMPRGGLPRIMTPNQNQYIHMIHLRKQYQTALRTANLLPGLCRMHVDTVLKHLRDGGVHARHPVQHPRLSLQHIQARLQYSDQHVQ